MRLLGVTKYREWYIVASFKHRRAKMVRLLTEEQDARHCARGYIARGAYKVLLYPRDPTWGDVSPVGEWFVTVEREMALSK